MFEADVIAKVRAPQQRPPRSAGLQHGPGGALLGLPFEDTSGQYDELADCFDYGNWAGGVFRLARFLATPVAARDGPVEWAQSMGKVVISYDLPDDCDIKDITVEMNRWQIKVSSPGPSGKREPWPDMTRDLRHTVRSLNSFWFVDETDDQRALSIILTKQDHTSWRELWKPTPAGTVVFRRSPFIHSSATYATSGDDRWTTLPRDAPKWGTTQAPNVEKPYTCFPAKLCIGAHDLELEGEFGAAIYVLFDRYHLQQLHGFMPLEEILMAEISERLVKVYLKFLLHSKEYVQIFEAALETDCIPEQSTWAMTWRRTQSPVGDFPALQLRLALRHAGGATLLRRVRHVADLGAPEQMIGTSTELAA